MITKEQSKPGATVMYGDHQCTVLQGTYEDPELGTMIKTSRFPGGMPLDKYDPMPLGHEEAQATASHPEVIEAALPAITFELALIDEVEPVKITAALIREKVKPLTELTIKNMFDDAGYANVKKAVTKSIKLRTAIEKQEKEHLGKLKATYDTKKKEVTDYTAELYIACREAQTALEAKLTAIDVAKKAAQDKLDADEKARTEGRDAKLFELGMTFNGQAFMGYGKVITKNSLYSLSPEAFDTYVQEIEALQLEQGFTGEVKETPVTPVIGGAGSSFTIKPSSDFDMGAEPVKLFDNEVYSVSVGGYTWVLTKGSVVSIPGQVIVNQQIMQSAIYSQVIENK
jgi:hypothetical protein